LQKNNINVAKMSVIFPLPAIFMYTAGIRVQTIVL